MAAVFAGLEHLDSVWTWLSRESTAQFIQNLEEGLWGQPGWNVYFKAGEEDFRRKLSNLYAILGNQPYLIKMGGTEDVTWQVTGAPALRRAGARAYVLRWRR